MVPSNKSSTNPLKPEMHRVFFALIPNADALDGIAALQADHQPVKARYLPQDKIHLTLLFLGNLNNDELDCAKSAAAKVKQKHFTLKLDKTGVFKKTKILWLGLNTPNEKVLSLYEELKLQIQQCGITTEKRKFTPHITIARKFLGKHINNPTQVIHFPATHFYLIESIPVEGNVSYEIVETYPLK